LATKGEFSEYLSVKQALHVTAKRSSSNSSDEVHLQTAAIGMQDNRRLPLILQGDPTKQVQLRGHDDELTAFAMSPGGNMLATGQRGQNSDVVVWDTKQLAQKFRWAQANRQEWHYRLQCKDHATWAQ
jgi:WD40 repeat protein